MRRQADACAPVPESTRLYTGLRARWTDIGDYILKLSRWLSRFAYEVASVKNYENLEKTFQFHPFYFCFYFALNFRPFPLILLRGFFLLHELVRR